MAQMRAQAALATAAPISNTQATEGEQPPAGAGTEPSKQEPANENGQAPPTNQPAVPSQQAPSFTHVEEVVQILKTAHPLLILTMETVVDQIQYKFRQPPDEEFYRILTYMIGDVVSVSLI